MDKDLKVLETLFINVMSIHLYTCIVMAYIYFRAGMSFMYIIKTAFLGIFPILVNIANTF